MCSKRIKRLVGHRAELVARSREAALGAIQIYNNPTTMFKSESFIVLMTIAWTYLLHAFYMGKVDYRYSTKRGRKREYVMTNTGEYKYWSLEQCLKWIGCPLDDPTKENIRFLIPIRHQIEHKMLHDAKNIDAYISARLQACAVNYNRYLEELFGVQNGLREHLALSIQLHTLSRAQIGEIEADISVPDGLKNYIIKFDNDLDPLIREHPHFALRLVFTRVGANHPGQADYAISFVSPDSTEGHGLEKRLVMVRDRERVKYLPGRIVELMKEQGFTWFNMTKHIDLWKQHDAKNPSKGFGVQVEKKWYWYESWLMFVRRHCEENNDHSL